MVQCRILEGAVMCIVVANAETSDVLWLVIRIVVIDVVKVRAYASGFAHATYASICRQQRSLKRTGDMLPWHGIHPRRIDLSRPNSLIIWKYFHITFLKTWRRMSISSLLRAEYAANFPHNTTILPLYLKRLAGITEGKA
jgi:hypothetical protein